MVGVLTDPAGEKFVAEMLNLHTCYSCDQTCDCGGDEAECIACGECREFFLRPEGMGWEGISIRPRGPAMHPDVVEDMKDAGYHVEDVTSNQVANWCCGPDHFPFHYIDCSRYGGMGVGYKRNADGEDSLV